MVFIALILLLVLILLFRLPNNNANILRDAILVSHPEKTIGQAFNDAFGEAGKWIDYNENNTDYVMYVNTAAYKDICVIFKITKSYDVVVDKLYLDLQDYTNATTDFMDRVYYAPESFK